MSAGLFYSFSDEKYLDLDGLRRIIIGYFTVSQDSWNRMAPDRRELKVPNNITRIARIERILDEVPSIAALTYADLNRELLPKEVRDGTNDVPDMARFDNAWSVAVAFGLMATLRYLCYKISDVQNVDHYYDTKSLKQKHQAALKNVVEKTFKERIMMGRRQGLIPREFRAKVRRFEPISKAAQGSTPDKFQAGVLLTHYLLQNASDLILSSGNQHIYVSNITKQLKDYIQKFAAA